MTEYAAIALALLVGAAMGAMIREALIKKQHEPRPVWPATKIKLAVTVIEAETRARTEPPTMAELAREQSDKVKAKWINERLPGLMDRAMQSVYEAGKEGRRSVVFYTGEGRGGLILNTKSKEAALAVDLKDMLRSHGFDVVFDWATHKTDSHGYGMIISW